MIPPRPIQQPDESGSPGSSGDTRADQSPATNNAAPAAAGSEASANPASGPAATNPVPSGPVPRAAASGDTAGQSPGAGTGSPPPAPGQSGAPSSGLPQREPQTSLPRREPQTNLPQRQPQTSLPQREPQTNLSPAGSASLAPKSPPVGLGGGGNTTNARTTADLAAKAARKEAAMAKSVGIDGPTRSIARPELVKDLPDLSEMRHPLPTDKPQVNPVTVPHGPVSPAVPAAAKAVAGGQPLRATVQIRRIDPWSTLKISLVILIALFFVWMLAVGLLYLVLEGMGVWGRLNSTFTEMVSPDSQSSSLITAGTVFGYSSVIGLVNVVLFTALATVGTFIYNQCCDMVGGIQITLADPD
ncbi:MAG: DUF3566 domain-containing protein [Mycobacterium sp.]|nr:DUF3566 domain-containing protein [Mycobacterium sp.]